MSIEPQHLRELDYGISMAVQIMIRALGMHAENQYRLARGETIAYAEDAFEKLIEETGMHHNSILKRWEGLA